ncbi:hypothetical protein A4X13_0g7296 [Tilletia indica]|uniref:Initiator tRNA phosphoribosyl transferase n=1 Tax=Tilletia indica TaxID=43049 RepID=A0A177TKU0_9BASI|nr:hypothetical protein A4X13_0g7296 [Tilletia indica]
MELDSEIKALQKDLHKERRRRERDLFNRLWSIKHDAEFVSRVADALDLPLVANLRCGAWYTAPRQTRATCYFKSTDGHTGQWGFSLKRHNLGLVNVIVKSGGCIIVDSTRSGKTMPDALSKTIPIWCAVLNRASALSHPGSGVDRVEGSDSLVTPERLVSRSEHEQMDSRVDLWAKALVESDLSVPRLDGSLRPFFVTTDTDLDELAEEIATGVAQDPPGRPTTGPEGNGGPSSDRPSFIPVILLSASHAPSQADPSPSSSTLDNRGLDYDYVQGSGDDEENWSQGLTPSLFWDPEYHDRILGAGRGVEIEGVVREVVSRTRDITKAGKEEEGEDGRKEVVPTNGREEREVGRTGIFLGVVPLSKGAQEEWEKDVMGRYGLVVQCDGVGSSVEEAVAQIRERHEVRLVRLGFKQGKAGAGPFGHFLPVILNALISRLCRGDPSQDGVEVEVGSTKILLCDMTGHDLAPSLAVALLSACFGPGPDRRFLSDDQDRWAHQAQLDKDQVRRRLQWVMGEEAVESNKAGPARTFLNRVNGEVLAVGRRADYESRDPMYDTAAALQNATI